MAQTWHQYNVPRSTDTTLHWHELKPELVADCLVTDRRQDVTCPGCRQWIDARSQAAQRCN